MEKIKEEGEEEREEGRSKGVRGREKNPVRVAADDFFSYDTIVYKLEKKKVGTLSDYCSTGPLKYNIFDWREIFRGMKPSVRNIPC